jgi:glycosyltransferase involved in cell wall biosynthesis
MITGARAPRPPGSGSRPEPGAARLARTLHPRGVDRHAAGQGDPSPRSDHMRILMVAPQPFFRPRGTPFSVLHRIRALVRLGHTVHLATYPFGETPEIPGLTVHRAARPRLVRDVRIGPSPAKLLLDVPLFRLATRLAATGDFDLLHTHEEAGWIGPLLGRRYGLPHLYDMHSSLPQQLANFGRYNWPPLFWAFRALERRTLDGADAVIAVCPTLRDHVLATGYDRPLALIENSLDFDPPPLSPAAVHELRHRLALGDGPVIVYTGTLEPYQGLELLVAAAPAVLDAVEEARFVVVGGTPAQVDQLRSMVAARGVAAAFRILPAVPPREVFLYHHLADVLVTTRARGTNTPLKVYQYLRAGRPIVATDISSHTQVLDTRSAELVAPEPSGIAAGLVRVLTDPDRAARLAAAAGRLARERYGEDAYLERLRDLLARLRPPLARVGAA